MRSEYDWMLPVIYLLIAVAFAGLTAFAMRGERSHD